MAFGSKPSRFTGAHKAMSAGQSAVNPKVACLRDEWLTYVKAKGLTLTASQGRFADTLFTGANCFLTGEAGTGKSYLLQALFDFLSANRVNVGRCALTGVAAFQIGGQTLHSFCGIGLGDEPLENLLLKVAKNGKAKARMKAIDVLFIDEISMAKGDLLDKVDGVLRNVRYSALPWGGVQIVATGDFLQLPPVFKTDERQQLAFQCEAWRNAGLQSVVLKEVVRQQGDQTLLQVARDIRVGRTNSLHLLASRVDAAFPDDGIEPVRLFCKNVDVGRYNAERLEALPGKVTTFKARDMGQPYHTDAFNRNCPAPQELDLKVGALVTLLVNLDVDQGLVNGSVGVVKAFSSGGVRVQFKSGTALVELAEWHIKEQEAGVDGKVRFKTVATRRQMPLKLAWAGSVHKAQGQTLDRVILDVREAFAEGQIYVALSRVRNLESLSIVGSIPAEAIRVNRDCVRFYRELECPEGTTPVDAPDLMDEEDVPW